MPTNTMTPAQERLRLAIIATLEGTPELTPQEHLAILAGTLGQLLAIHVRNADNPRGPVELVMKNIDLGRRSILL